jgi:hypothetical protein
MRVAGHADAAELPIFDAHVHYSHDAWDNLPPKDAVAILHKAGLKRALVSSSGDEGTQRLVREAPDLVVPSLRPYRTRGEVGTWVRDDTVATFLEERLSRQRYAAIGEFHLYGADADLPVPKRMVALAKQHRLVLHAHSDVDAIERLFRSTRRACCGRTGFDAEASANAKSTNLWCDLAFRNEHGGSGKVPADWRALFAEFPDRFTVGTDTFTPERWHYVVEHANWSRAWLADLPPALAERIAWRNGEALFASWNPRTAHEPARTAAIIMIACAAGAARRARSAAGRTHRRQSSRCVVVRDRAQRSRSAATSPSTSPCACGRRSAPQSCADANMPEHRHG